MSNCKWHTCDFLYTCTYIILSSFSNFCRLLSNLAKTHFLQRTRYAQKQSTLYHQMYMLYLIQCCPFCTQIFNDMPDRIVPVWAWQTGYRDYTRQAIENLGTGVTSFKALGITGYFGCDRVTSASRHVSMFFYLVTVCQIQKNAIKRHVK